MNRDDAVRRARALKAQADSTSFPEEATTARSMILALQEEHAITDQELEPEDAYTAYIRKKQRHEKALFDRLDSAIRDLCDYANHLEGGREFFGASSDWQARSRFFKEIKDHLRGRTQSGKTDDPWVGEFMDEAVYQVVLEQIETRRQWMSSSGYSPEEFEQRLLETAIDSSTGITGLRSKRDVESAYKRAKTFRANKERREAYERQYTERKSKLVCELCGEGGMKVNTFQPKNPSSSWPETWFRWGGQRHTAHPVCYQTARDAGTIPNEYEEEDECTD